MVIAEALNTLAVTDDGKHVLVTEWHGHCVAVFSAATGELRRKIGHGIGRFGNPDEVEIFRDNYIFVKDENSLQKFAFNGFHDATINVRHMGEELEYNYGMAVLPCGNVLTTVKLPYRTGSSIVKIKRATLFQQSFWQWTEVVEPDTYDGEPADIAIDTEGRIYVLTQDYGIHTFTPEGKYVNSFGKDTNKLNEPYEFCIDSRNIIYVTDGNNVKMFATSGRFLGSFGNLPKLKGVTVSKNTGDLYISKANGDVYVSRNT